MFDASADNLGLWDHNRLIRPRRRPRRRLVRMVVSGETETIPR
jgi:hypothetical protein